LIATGNARLDFFRGKIELFAKFVMNIGHGMLFAIGQNASMGRMID